MNPDIFVLITTYQRQALALRTIQGVNDYLNYDGDVRWLIYDDGSPTDYLAPLRESIDNSPNELVDVYRSEHRGVGHGMNWGLRRMQEFSGSLIVILEDDWELREPIDFNPYVCLLTSHLHIGMVRLGYLSYGLQGRTFNACDKLWMEFINNKYQYIYAGHASIRHIRLHDKVGFFQEGLAPGANELNFCGRYNSTPEAPAVVWDMDYGRWGPFHHIGGESLADISPTDV